MSALLVYVVWRLQRARALKRLLVELAHWRVESTTQAPLRVDAPDDFVLAQCAFVMEAGRREGESNQDAASRVFGLEP